MTSVGAVLLAAGRGERFRSPADESKLTASLAGRPLIQHAASAIAGSRAAPVVVVLGHAAIEVDAALAGFSVRCVANPDYPSGLASSLREGTAALPQSATGAVVALGDMPFVRSQTINCLVALFERDPDLIDAVVPRFNGRRGNPVLLGRRLFDRVARLAGDQGARQLIADPSCRVVECDVDDAGIGIDVDTLEALRAVEDSKA